MAADRTMRDVFERKFAKFMGSPNHSQAAWLALLV
jgi:hypothetical protein